MKIFKRNGDYSKAEVVADSGGVHIVRLDVDTLETVSPVDGSKTGIGYSGTFYCWFDDKKKFITTEGLIARIYSVSGSRVGIFKFRAEDELGGSGDWFWTNSIHSPDYAISIYKIGGDPGPIKTLPNTSAVSAAASGKYLVAGNEVINLQSDSMVSRPWIGPGVSKLLKYGLPSYGWSGPFGYFANFFIDDSGSWIAGTDRGALVNGDLQVSGGKEEAFALGSVNSMASSPSGEFAVSSPLGKILVYKRVGDSAQLERELERSSNSMKISKDGKILAFVSRPVAGDTSDTLFLYSIEQDRYLKTLTFPGSYATLFNFNLSDDGHTVSMVSGTYVGLWYLTSRILTDTGNTDEFHSAVTGVAPRDIETSASWAPILSHDGKSFIIVSADGKLTKIYDNGKLADAVIGYGVGWLSDSLLATISNTDLMIYDITGKLLKTTPVPSNYSGFPGETVLLSDSTLFSPRNNSVYDFNAGKTLFTLKTPEYFVSMIVGSDRVAFIDEARLQIGAWPQNSVSIKMEQRIREQVKSPVIHIGLDRQTAQFILDLGGSGRYSLYVYNLDGKMLWSFSDRNLDAGKHLLSWKTGSVTNDIAGQPLFFKCDFSTGRITGKL